MARIRALTAAGVAASAFVAFVPGNAVPASRATLAVGVTVLPRTEIESESSPATLTVTAADVSRGYVDLPAATRLSVWNTSPAGYVVDVWPAVNLFSAADVEAAGGVATVGDAGGTVVARGARGRGLPLVMSVRFHLAPHVGPGRYPWPLRYQVRPLGP
jgi:hypothetical protein